jgi:hypothetical protein
MTGPKTIMTLYLTDEAGQRLGSRRLPEGLTGIRQLHELIAQHAEEPAQVVIGIETDRGLWVNALTAAGYQVFALNPLAVARYRDRHHISGAKSDASDAKLLADLVRTDRHNHRPIASDSGQAEAIKVLARAHQNLIWARTRHTNGLRSALREYYPAALQAFDDPADRDALAILGRAPAAVTTAFGASTRATLGIIAAGRAVYRTLRPFRRRTVAGLEKPTLVRCPFATPSAAHLQWRTLFRVRRRAVRP